MKRPIYLLSLIGFAALAVAGGDPITLKLSLDKPFTQNYLVESKMVQQIDLSAAGQGEQEMVMNTSMLYKYDVEKAGEDGKAGMKTTVSDIKVDMEGMPAGQASEMPKEIVMKGKIDSLGKMYEMKMEGQVNPQVEAMMGSATNGANSLIFPDKPVKVGDTWKYKIPGTKYTKEAELTATLVETKTDGGVIHKIKVTGAVPTETKIGADDANSAGQSMTIKGVSNMVMNYDVDGATGWTKSMSGNIQTESTIEIESVGMSIKMKGAGTVKMTVPKKG